MNEYGKWTLPSSANEDVFPTVRKGYDKHAVEEFMSRSHTALRGVQERLAQAHAEIERLRAELARLQHGGGATATT